MEVCCLPPPWVLLVVVVVVLITRCCERVQLGELLLPFWDIINVMQVPLVKSTTCYTIAPQVSGFTEFLTENINKRREKLPTQARLPSYFPSTLVRRVRHAHVIKCWCHPTSPQLGSLSRCPACRQPKRRHFSRGGNLYHIS